MGPRVFSRALSPTEVRSLLRTSATRCLQEGVFVLATVEVFGGIQAVVGITWGLRRGSWRSVIRNRIGHCEFDAGSPSKGTVPAAALATSVVRPEHASDVCFVALVNDEGDRFLTVVIADGAPTVFSEEAYDDRSKWNLTIDEAIQNSSINRIYLQEDCDLQQGGIEKSNGNICWFASAELSVPPGIRPVYKRNRFKFVLAGVVIATVVCGGTTIGWFVQDQDMRAQKMAEAALIDERITETSRLDTFPIIDHCVETLGEFWPMAPEWTLVEEGCVVNPDRLPRSVPKIQTHNAFSFRRYRLVGRWNEFLAGHAAARVTREFSGSIHRDTSSIVLYREIVPSRLSVERGFQPEVDVVSVLDRLFVGNIKIEDGAGSRRDIVEASTTLELLAVLNRMKTDMTETVSVTRRLDSGLSKMRVRPVRLRTERTGGNEKTQHR